jgi:molybdenum-dependent DNA-binding transcriptional regulator ModE
VCVAKSDGIGRKFVWAAVQAQNTITAEYPIEAQYGRGNVIGVTLLGQFAQIT